MVIDQEARLIPGPSGPLRVGIDDEIIQNIAQDNIWALEGDDRPDDVDGYYVVLVETDIVPLTLEEDIPLPVKEFRAHNLIRACSMVGAIALFEEDNGKRLWMPASWGKNGQRFEKQIGMSRISKDKMCRFVRIERVRKDCVLGLSK